MKTSISFIIVLATILGPIGCNRVDELIEVPSPESTDGMDRELVEAIERLIPASKIEGIEGESFLELAKTYHANGLNELANRSYRIHLAQFKEDAKIWFLQGLTAVSLGRLDEADECFKQVIHLRADYPGAYWRLALVRLDQAKPNEAFELVKKSLALSANDENSQLVLARTLIELERPGESIPILERMNLVDSPNSGYARFLLGSALRNQGKIDLAARYLTKEIQRPQWSDPWRGELTRYELGFSGQRIKASQFYRAGRFDDAIPILNLCVRNPNADGRDWNLLGASYLGKKQLDLAIRAFETGLERFPDDYDSNMNLARTYLLMLPKKGSMIFDKALPLLQKASDVRPDRWEPRDAIGQILNMQGRLDEALVKYDEACHLALTIEMCHWRKIMVLIDLRRFQDVENELNRLSQGHKGSPFFLFASAVVAKQSGEVDRAKQFISQLDRSTIKDKALSRRLDSLMRSIDLNMPSFDAIAPSP